MARIILAEDDVSMRQFLTAALERVGHRITACPDGLSALETLEKDSAFDLLLADIVMPGMDGIELARLAGQKWPDLKVMFITGFAAVAMGENKDSSVQARILSKPFHLNELINQIDTLLDA